MGVFSSLIPIHQKEKTFLQCALPELWIFWSVSLHCSRLQRRRRRVSTWISWTSWSMTVYIFLMKVWTKFLNSKSWKLRCLIHKNGSKDLFKRDKRGQDSSTHKRMSVPKLIRNLLFTNHIKSTWSSKTELCIACRSFELIWSWQMKMWACCHSLQSRLQFLSYFLKWLVEFFYSGKNICKLLVNISFTWYDYDEVLFFIFVVVTFKNAVSLLIIDFISPGGESGQHAELFPITTSWTPKEIS